MLGIMGELVDEGLGQFYDNYVDKSKRFFINPINWSVLSIQRLLGILFVEVVFKNRIQHDIMEDSQWTITFLLLAIPSGGWELCVLTLLFHTVRRRNSTTGRQ